jgi:two-component system OmpR family response regulator
VTDPLEERRRGTARYAGDVPSSTAGAMPELGLEAVRVLVVDDNRDAAESLALMLSLEGFRVETAEDGYAGLGLARTFRPRVILLDIGLPGMDGYQVARRLRDDPETARLSIVAVSGYGSEEDRERARAAGFDFHLVKPVDPERLMELLAALSQASLGPVALPAC